MQNLCKTSGAARAVSNLYLSYIRAAFTVHTSLPFLMKTSQRQGVKAIYQLCRNSSNEIDGVNLMTQKSENLALMKSSLDKSPFELALDALFTYTDSEVTPERFDEFLKTWLQKSHLSGVSNIVRIVGKKSTHSYHSHVKRNLPQIAARLQGLSDSTSEWNVKKISIMLYSLHNHEESDAGFCEIVSLMSELLEKEVSMGGTSRPRDTSTILYGLRNCKYQTEASKRIMNSLGLMMKANHLEVDAQAVGNSLYGLQGMSSDDPEVRSLVSALATYVSQCHGAPSAQEIGNAVYGLQGMTGDHEEVRSLLRVLAIYVNSSTDTMSSQAIGNALYGLQGMSSDYTEVQCLLQILATKIRCSRCDLKAQHIGNALFGLQNMRSDYIPVLSLLSAITSLLKRFSKILTSQNIGNALYGLRRMSSRKQEVRLILQALVPHVHRCAEPLNGQEIGNALYGLQSMTSDYKAVLMMLSAIALKVESCTGLMKGQEISNALYGLQGMSSGHEEVRLVLRALLPHIRNFEGIMSGQQVSNSLYGLKCMSSDDEEVLLIVSALTPHVRLCEEAMKGHEMGSAVLGVKGMSGRCEEVVSLLSAIAPLVFNCKATLNLGDIANIMQGLQGTLNSQAGRDIVSYLFRKILSASYLDVQTSVQCENLGRAVALMNLPSTGLLTASDLEDWEGVCTGLKRNIQSAPTAPTPTAEGSLKETKQETRLHAAALRALQESSLSVTRGEYLFHFFECDVIVRIPFSGRRSGDREHLILNIEVDGVQHLEESKGKADRERDAYLRSRGVIILRVTTKQLKQLSDFEVNEAVMHAIVLAILQ